MELFLAKEQQQSSETGTTTHAAIVMLSNFGPADGGRETWAYNFIPRLLDRYPKLRLRIFGLHLQREPDNRDTLLNSIPSPARDRVSADFVQARSGRLPNAIAFWRGLPKLATGHPAPAVVVAVGSWVELLAVLRTPTFRSSRKLVWLRSIFADEKAHRYPRVLRPLLEQIELAVLRRADGVIANGEDTADHYRGLGLTIRVIPNGVDLNRWRMPAVRLNGPIDVLFAGRLATAKGIEDFVDIARIAKERGVEGLRFRVVGDPPLPSVNKAHEDGVLLYEGPVPNEQMPAVLSRIHACVALTYVRGDTDRFSGGAGVSNALLEQMAAGRVVVAWDNAAFNQVLDDNCAFLVPQGDREAVLAALVKMRASPSVAESRAARAAEIAENFSLDRHIARFSELAGTWLEGAETRKGSARRP